ncbi:hypothetical protein ACVWZZ_000518 [Bradyrhizobium sp. LM6.10]
MLRVLGQTSTNPSGRRDVVWPVRQNTQMLGQPASPKIFRFTEIRKRRMYRRNPAQGRGAYRDRHERGPGGGGRRSHRREWFRRAESRERRRRAHDRCDRRTAKSCRPGARSLCAKSCGDVCCPTGPRASAIRRATGAIVHRSPGRARHKPFQPLRREGRMLGFTCMPLCNFVTTTSHSGPRVPAGTRSSLRSLSFEGETTKQSSGETRRENASPCQAFNNDLVPRTQRSASWRCAAEPGPMQQRVRGFLGPGSAQQREEALQRVRDTRVRAS